MWEPVVLFFGIGLAKWLAREWRMAHQPPQHIFGMLDAIKRRHSDTPVGNFQEKYLW